MRSVAPDIRELGKSISSILTAPSDLALQKAAFDLEQKKLDYEIGRNKIADALKMSEEGRQAKEAANKQPAYDAQNKAIAREEEELDKPLTPMDLYGTSAYGLVQMYGHGTSDGRKWAEHIHDVLGTAKDDAGFSGNYISAKTGKVLTRRDALAAGPQIAAIIEASTDPAKFVEMKKNELIWARQKGDITPEQEAAELAKLKKMSEGRTQLAAYEAKLQHLNTRQGVLPEKIFKEMVGRTSEKINNLREDVIKEEKNEAEKIARHEATLMRGELKRGTETADRKLKVDTLQSEIKTMAEQIKTKEALKAALMPGDKEGLEKYDKEIAELTGEIKARHTEMRTLAGMATKGENEGVHYQKLAEDLNKNIKTGDAKEMDNLGLFLVQKYGNEEAILIMEKVLALRGKTAKRAPISEEDRQRITGKGAGAQSAAPVKAKGSDIEEQLRKIREGKTKEVEAGRAAILGALEKAKATKEEKKAAKARIEKLDKMYEEGLISEDEYNQLK